MYSIVIFNSNALSLSCCHLLTLIRSPVFSTHYPGVTTVKLDSPPCQLHISAR